MSELFSDFNEIKINVNNVIMYFDYLIPLRVYYDLIPQFIYIVK